MSTALIVAFAIWNGLLGAGLVALIRWRRHLRSWVTGLDDVDRSPPGPADDGAAKWATFLAEHPELLLLGRAADTEHFAPGAPDA
jgi:hypothetical protein